jgi:hypothetical protein
MKCPKLKQWYVLTCYASNEPYIPSLFQLHEYCKSKDYKKCPFFLKLIIEKKDFYNEEDAISI